MDQFKFSASSMESFTRELRDTALRVRTETDEAVAVTGGMIRDEAIEVVKAHSQSIPPTIHMDTVPGKAIIHAGSASVPLAVLYEKGNRRGEGFDSRRTVTKYGARGSFKQKSFKHPVFGDQTNWVDQARYPFLSTARNRVRDAVKPIMERAWDKALEPLRLR